MTQIDHGIIDYLLVTNVDWLNALAADVREQFLTIVAKVTETPNKESTAVNSEAKQAIIDAGDVGQENIDAAQAINATLAN